MQVFVPKAEYIDWLDSADEQSAIKKGIFGILRAKKRPQLWQELRDRASALNEKSTEKELKAFYRSVKHIAAKAEANSRLKPAAVKIQHSLEQIARENKIVINTNLVRNWFTVIASSVSRFVSSWFGAKVKTEIPKKETKAKSDKVEAQVVITSARCGIIKTAAAAIVVRPTNAGQRACITTEADIAKEVPVIAGSQAVPENARHNALMARLDALIGGTSHRALEESLAAASDRMLAEGRREAQATDEDPSTPFYKKVSIQEDPSDPQVNPELA